ncbi:MAG: hypothetical protein ACLGHQ_02140 [Acidimicrobiia bacterium]
MTWILLGLVAVVAVGVVFGAALASGARRDRRARLEIVPGVATAAPVAWAGAHTREAKLHRRLGDAVRAMRAHSPLGASVFAEQRSALEQEALRIDGRLIAFAALTGERRTSGIEEVAGLVERFESAVADLVTASLDDPASLEAAISESELRLRALEAARAEVERLDRPSG